MDHVITPQNIKWNIALKVCTILKNDEFPWMFCVNINTISANNYGTPVHLCKLSLLWLKKMATIIFMAGVWALNFYYDRGIRVFPFHSRFFWLQLMKTSGFINNNILQESISTCVKSHYMLQVSSEIFVLHRVSVMPNDYIPFHSKIINFVIHCSYSDVYVFFYGLNAISYCCLLILLELPIPESAVLDKHIFPCNAFLFRWISTVWQSCAPTIQSLCVGPIWMDVNLTSHTF